MEYLMNFVVLDIHLMKGRYLTPGNSAGKESACNAGDTRDRFYHCIRKSPWRRKWQSSPVFLPGKPHAQRRLAGYSPKGLKESDTTEWLSNSCFQSNEVKQKMKCNHDCFRIHAYQHFHREDVLCQIHIEMPDFNSSSIRTFHCTRVFFFLHLKAIFERCDSWEYKEACITRGNQWGHP